MENHSGVADRTGYSVDSAVARVKGEHHDGDVLSWMALYAIKSGGTASPLVLLDERAFLYLKNAKITAPSYLQKKNKKNTKEKTNKRKQAKHKRKQKSKNHHSFKEELKCTTKSPIT